MDALIRDVKYLHYDDMGAGLMYSNPMIHDDKSFLYSLLSLEIFNARGDRTSFS